MEVGLRDLAHQEVCVILTGLASQTPPLRDSGRLRDRGCCVSGSWTNCLLPHSPASQDPAWGPMVVGVASETPSHSREPFLASHDSCPSEHSPE